MIAHHIHRLKQKPEHVRQRVALGTAVGISGVVALFWLVALVAGGSLSLSLPTLPTDALAANSTGADASAPTTNFQALMGAAVAASGGSTSTPALTIVDNGTASTLHSATTSPANSATILPF